MVNYDRKTFIVQATGVDVIKQCTRKKFNNIVTRMTFLRLQRNLGTN